MSPETRPTATSTYLEDGLHVRSDEAGRGGDEVSEHARRLLLVAAQPAVLQLSQDLRVT